MKLFLILLGVLSVPQEREAPGVLPALPALLELGPEDSRDAQERRYRAFVVTSAARGRLFVTASARGREPARPGLAFVTTTTGEPEIAECGPSTVVASLDVIADQELEIRVYRTPEDGEVALSARLAVETDDTLARAQRVLTEMVEIREDAPPADTVDRLRTLLDQLVAPDTETVSPAQHYVADQFTRLPPALRPATLEVRAAELLHRYSERNLPPAHPGRLAATALYGFLLEGAGLLARARDVQAEYVKTLSDLRPEDDRGLLEARLNYGGTLLRLGELQAAMDVLQPVYSAASRTYAAGDRLFDEARRSYAAALLGQGRVDRAAELLRAQLADLAVAAEPNALAVARAQRDLARALLEIGELVAAEERIAEAWPVLSSALEDRDPERVRALVLQGQVQLAVGDLVSAAVTLEEALTAMEVNAPERPRTRHSLAMVHLALGETEIGTGLLEALIQSLPDGHRERGTARLVLAMLDVDEGALSPARAELEDLLLSVEGAEKPDPTLLAAVQEALAWAHSEAGNLEAALPLQEDALARWEDRLPQSHPIVHRARLNLAWIQVRQGRLRPAASGIRAAARGIESRLRQTGAGRGTRELEALAMQSSRSLGEMLSLLAAVEAPDWREPLEEELFSLVESLRNVSADRRRLTGAAARADADLLPWVDSVREAAAEVVRLSWAGSDDLVEAVKAQDAAERALFSELAEREPELVRSRTTSAAAVSDALAPDEAAVSYWRYVRTNLDPDTDAALPPRDHYLAYVLRAGEPLRRIELGDAEQIDAAVDRWRRAMIEGTDRGLSAARQSVADSGPSPGEALRTLALDPLEDALGDATMLHVAFDDALHTVPFDALPAATGDCVGDRLRIVSRTSLRELTRGRRHAPSIVPRLVALGGLEYDQVPAPREEPAERLAALSFRSAPPWVEAREFAYLRESRGEADEVERLFLEEHEGAEVELYVGQEGSRIAFESAAPGATHLHLATHAYFAPQSVPSTRETRGGGLGLMDLRAQVRGFAPHVLCGLAFAGANLVPSEEDPFPRLMTAGELMTLDLSRCELAVLSACDTSVGVRRAGQGVASLQQALHAAGARSMITSLWKVPDAATRELMEEFYRRLWKEGDSAADALWKAKRSLRYQSDGERPRYTRRAWAGWVLSGEPR